MRAPLVLAAVLVLGLAPACGSTAVRQHVSAGAIVFTTNLGSDAAVYAVNPDGSGLRRLFTVPGQALVLWNSRGTKALVLTYGRHNSGYLLDWPSGKKLVLREKGLDSTAAPAWSPDGRKLLLTNRQGLVVYDVATDRWRRIDAGEEDDLGWSANSKTVLDMTGYDGLISGVPITGGPSRPIAYVHHSNDGFPGESADGKWLSFIGAYDSDLFVLRRSGGLPRRVAHDAVNAVAGSWSPRGERLAYATGKGVGVIDFARGRRLFVKDSGLDPLNETPSWSPDGKWVLYWRTDLGYGAPGYDHLRLWAMRANGTGAHAVTQMTPNDGLGAVAWVSATVRGRPVPRRALVSPARGRTTTIPLPVVALGARGGVAAVATGFGSAGGIPPPRVPLGPIVTVNGAGKTSQVQVHGCKAVDSVFVMSTHALGYVCDNDSVGYGFDYALRLGSATLVHTIGGEFTGAYLSGVATDGRTVAFGVEHTRPPSQVTAHFQIQATRIYASRGSGRELVATLRGVAAVEAVEGDRIAVLRRNVVHVFSLAGRETSVRVPGHGVDGVALDGPRLVVLEDRRVVLFDLGSGLRLRSWRTAQALAANLDGATSQLAGVQGHLLAYVVDTTVHVLDLSTGREVVLDTPGATGPVSAGFGAGELFYAYNEAYARRPGRVGFISIPALERAISAHGAQAR